MNDDRPRKLTPPSVLVIWAAHELTIHEKVVWYRDWSLDQWPNGSYAGPKALAASLGDSVKPESVAAIRRRLKRLGLYYAIDRGEGANVGWVATLPADYRARTSREAAGLAVLLDKYVVAFDRGLVPAPSTKEQPPGVATDTPPVSRGAGVQAAALSGGLGAHFSVSQSEAQLPSEVREKRVSASAPDEKREQRPLSEAVTEGMALRKLTRGEALTIDERQLVRGWLDRQDAATRTRYERRFKSGLELSA